MPTAYAYVRVSTDKQDLSPEWQEQVCRNYFAASLESRGFIMHPTVFADIGKSAYHIELSERPAGREMFQHLKRGDIIIAAKQDRLWRSVRDKENCMFFWRQIGVEVAILDTGIDTTTAAGKFASGIITLQAQWESDVRSERMKAAHSVRRSRRSAGKKYPPPGWYWDKVREELMPDTRERNLLEMIYRWRLGRARSIRQSCVFLTEEGVRRRNGCKYTADWVTRAHLAYVKGWPQAGFIQSIWKGLRGFDKSEANAGRLPKRELTHFDYRPHRANAADLQWIRQSFADQRESDSQSAAS
jgi:DNA invertase Pin-like site-specific DNA recombinase